MPGWIKLYRELLNKPIWRESTAETKAVLIALLLLVSWKSRTVFDSRGRKITLGPGEVCTDTEELRDACGNISRQNLRTALARLRSAEFIETTVERGGPTRIKVINFQSFQNENEANQQTNQQTNHQTESETPINSTSGEQETVSTNQQTNQQTNRHEFPETPDPLELLTPLWQRLPDPADELVAASFFGEKNMGPTITRQATEGEEYSGPEQETVSTNHSVTEIPRGSRVSSHGKKGPRIDTNNKDLGEERKGGTGGKPAKNEKREFAANVKLKPNEFETLKAEFGEEAARQMVDILSEYKAGYGRNYRNDYAAIRKWVIRAWKERGARQIAGRPRGADSANQDWATIARNAGIYGVAGED